MGVVYLPLFVPDGLAAGCGIFFFHPSAGIIIDGFVVYRHRFCDRTHDADVHSNGFRYDICLFHILKFRNCENKRIRKRRLVFGCGTAHAALSSFLNIILSYFTITFFPLIMFTPFCILLMR